MNILKDMLKFSVVYVLAVVLSVLILAVLLEIGIVGTPAIVIFIIIIILTTMKFADYYWKQDFKNIWHIPISQAILHSAFSLFLYIRDLLGFRQSSGFLDFGVGFEIGIVAVLAAFWMIPSIAVALFYSVIERKFRLEHQDKAYVDADSKE